MKLNSLEDLIKAAKEIVTTSLTEAAITDSVTSFPAKTLEKIKAANLLTASISAKNGGQNLGLVAGTNLALVTILKIIGSGNLVLGRVVEGHLNALLLIDQFGTEIQKKRFAEDAFAGKLFGVWNTQANDGTFLSKVENGISLLTGAKTFATGTDYVSRPIVTAELPDGSWQMCIVPLEELDVKTDNSWWNPMGMKSSRSYKMNFCGSHIPAGNLLGEGGAYYEQPGFSGGSIRFAAVQLGAAEMLLDETRKYLQILNRTEDPYQKMRLGQMTILVVSGNQWLNGAADQLDHYMMQPSEQNSANFLSFANMMRTAIEQICVEVMALCQKCVGARGLNKPYHFERIIRDLSTYLRQPAPDETLSDVGGFVLKSEIPIDELWKTNSPNNI